MDTKGKSLLLLEEPEGPEPEPEAAGIFSDSNIHDKKPFAGAPPPPDVLPVRPETQDCPHLLRMGTCKFGYHCRYNHSVKWTNQAAAAAIREKHRSSGNASAAGGSTYGMYYKGSQPRFDTDFSIPDLNLHGLPIRLGEKKCHHYMRYGYCGYGVQCVFHHPGPMLRGIDKSFDDNYSSSSSWGTNSNGDHHQSLPLLPPPATGKSHRPWFSYTYPSFNYQNDNSSFYVNTNWLPQGPGMHSEWFRYQAPNYIPERSVMAHPNPVAKGADKMPDQNQSTTKVEEFPEHPDQPICAHLLKTGNCKFKSACRFHHPKNWVSKRDDCVLSDVGLPLRPDKEVCRHYRSFGLCKSGSACMFDHPVDFQFPTVKHRCSKTKEDKGSRSMTKQQ